VVGLGNPGRQYEHTRHNIGFEAARALIERWELSRPKRRFQAELVEGRAGAGGPRVAVLMPQTYMNEAGRAVGPARGTFHVDLDRVLVIHDEIDLPFGEVRTRVGGGLAGHNGLRSVKRELGDEGFARVRVGVGRPASSDPDEVSAYVLGRFSEAPEQVQALIGSVADAAEDVVLGRRAL
jgi:peptidyl-tRNA hydrolase, PTH1 family